MIAMLRRIPLWLPLWLLIAGISIALHGPMPLYSTRTLSVAWDMWRLGEWIVPHINGAAYSQKAPLLYWLIHLGWAVGGVSDVWPRVLEILLGALDLWLVAVLARQLFPERPAVARLAPWVLMGCAFFFLFALQVMFEQLLIACVLGALIALTRRIEDRVLPNWPLFTLATLAGLLTKGPVALLHVAPSLLTAPLWLPDARAQLTAWYRSATLAVLGACAGFAAWLIPAVILGGPAYRGDLLWNQTAGRVVQSFDHARPWWWYLAIAPILLFPWLFWPRAWRVLLLRDFWHERGARFLALWLAPTLLVFSLVSGKQAYYVLPQLAGLAILLAAAADRYDGTTPARTLLWLPGLLLVATGVVLIALPWMVASGRTTSMWLVEMSRAGGAGGVVVAAIGLLTLWPSRSSAHGIVRLSIATLCIVALMHAQFSITVWSRYDIAPTAQALANYAAQGRPLGNLGTYEGQYHFLGRLSVPIERVMRVEGQTWAQAHPNGILIDYPGHALPEDGPQPLLLQRFRSDWIAVWDARAWLQAQGQAAKAQD